MKADGQIEKARARDAIAASRLLRSTPENEDIDKIAVLWGQHGVFPLREDPFMTF
jgi:hypothetical protein